MRRLAFTLSFIALISAWLSVSHSGPSLTAQSSQSPPKYLPEPEFLNDYRLLSPEANRKTTDEKPIVNDLNVDSLSASINQYSMYTFMSLRDRNWEIYRANYAGGYATRLTNHESVDSSPRLNRGSTNISFASNRDGNFEIYTMDTSGKRLRRLTYSENYDYNPAWSPDGSRIVFESDRDGQLEIYSMKSDGSEKTRLTYHGAYDGQPYWSPDGEQIAFTSLRNGYGIWVMNADGTNPKQIVNKRFAQRPVWSPDGSKIAFDADGNGDGWQEIWVMDADGGNQNMLYQASNNAEPYVRAWTPANDFITYTQVHWIQYDDVWYWTYAETEYIRLSDSATFSINFGSDLDWYPDRRINDIVPPNSSVRPLPEYSSGDAHIDFRLDDGSGSGVSRIDVQTRVGDNGNWQDWFMDFYPGNSFTFTKIPGEKIYFRSRARDRIGNEEPWPTGNGDTFTTFYNSKIYGDVTNNRLLPLPGATLTSTQGIFQTHQSDETGHFRSYFDDESNFLEATLMREGYGIPAKTEFIAFDDNYVKLMQPPNDNILADPDLEAVAFSNKTWQATGIYTPTLTTSLKHTGKQGVQLGQSFDTEVVGVVHAPDLIWKDNYIIQQDKNHRFHIVWVSKQAEDDFSIHYASGDKAGDWNISTTVVSKTAEIDNLFFGITPEGKGHLIWKFEIDSDDFVYYSWLDGISWREPQLVYEGYSVYPYDFLVDGKGIGHLIVRYFGADASGIFYSHFDSNGTTFSSKNAFDKSFNYAELVVDKHDAIHIYLSGLCCSYYSYLKEDGSWQDTELITEESISVFHKEFIVDDTGNVHLFDGISHFSGEAIRYWKRLSHGSWNYTQIQTGITVDFKTLNAFTNPDGSLNLMFEENWNCQNLYLARYDKNGVFLGIEKINPQLTCFSNQWIRTRGNQTILLTHSRQDQDHFICQSVINTDAWTDTRECIVKPASEMGTSLFPLVNDDGSIHLFGHKYRPEMGTTWIHNRSLFGKLDGDSKIWQTFLIPDQLENPTLSFAYRQGFNGVDSDQSLNVSVEDSLHSTRVFTGTLTEGWTYDYVDLSAWSGKQVTLTFSIRQKEGVASAWAHLDEINLGSSYPDNWVKINAPPNFIPGETADLSLEYGNRSTAWAIGNIVSTTLPSEFTVLSAVPEPTSQMDNELTWSIGDLTANDSAGLITITIALSPNADLNLGIPVTAGISTDTHEPIIFNNIYTTKVMIGAWLYFPALFK